MQALEAGLVQEWIRLNRLLVLVEHSNESALLVYNLNNSENNDLERVIPIDTEFKSELGESNFLKNADCYWNIQYVLKLQNLPTAI